MKTSATLLMKELKAIEQEINKIHSKEIEESIVRVNSDLTPCYESTYSYEDTRAKLNELYARGAKIKSTLNNFNITTKVDGYDFCIADGLVKLAQLKSEGRTLETLANRRRVIYSNYRDESLQAPCYDVDKVAEDLKNLRSEISKLQVAIDKTNLNSSIEF